MRNVFVSYCHEDADFAQILKEELSKAGFGVWKDLDLRAGDNWRAEIDNAIKQALAVVVVMSARARASEYVAYEWSFALGAGVPVLPLLLKIAPANVHPRLAALQSLDFSNYMLRPWESLARALRELANADRPFTISPPRDAPPVVQQAAHALDSLEANERKAAIQTLAQMQHPAARDALAEAITHPVLDVRVAAAEALAAAKDVRAIPGLFDAIRNRLYYKVIDDFQSFDEDAAPALLQALNDADENDLVREAAAWTLGRMRYAAAFPALVSTLHGASAPKLRAAALGTLGSLGDPAANTWFIEALADRDSYVRRAAIAALRKSELTEDLKARAVAGFCQALRDGESDVRREAAEALVEMHNAAATPVLLEALRDMDSPVRSQAAAALGAIGDACAVGALIAAMRTHDSTTSQNAAAALARIGGEAAMSALLESLKDEETYIRISAVRALASASGPGIAAALIGALDDLEDFVRSDAADALGVRREASAVPALIARLQDEQEEEGVRYAASNALMKIGTPEGRAASRAFDRQERRRASAG